MQKNAIVLICAVFIYCTSLSAQVVRTIHQAFPMEKSYTQVHIDIGYPYQHETWAGDYVLVETTVNLSNASKYVMDFFQESGRYKVEQYKYQAGAGFRMKKMSRKTIQTSKGICEENVLIRLYVPEKLKVHAVGVPEVSPVTE